MESLTAIIGHLQNCMGLLTAITNHLQNCMGLLTANTNHLQKCMGLLIANTNHLQKHKKVLQTYKTYFPDGLKVLQICRTHFIEAAYYFFRCLTTSYLCRCLTASKSSMAALTDTLRESSAPSIGIRMCSSAASRHKSVSPVDSVPITIAVLRVMSES